MLVIRVDYSAMAPEVAVQWQLPYVVFAKFAARAELEVFQVYLQPAYASLMPWLDL